MENDQRYTTVLGQFQTDLKDLFREDPVVMTVLEGLAAPLVAVANTSTFREYITPLRKGKTSTLTADRAVTSGNQFTTDPAKNGKAVSGSHTNGYIDHTIEDTWTDAFDIDLTGDVDAQFNSASEQAARAKKQFDTSFTLWKDDMITAKALASNNWIVPETADVTLNGAIVAGATSFTLATGDAAASGIEEGDFVKIGNKREWGTKGGELEYLDVAMVTDVTGEVITIETDVDNFPTSMSQFGDTFVNGLDVELRAHATGTRVQIDKPTAVTEESIDDLIAGIMTQADLAFIVGQSLTLYVTPAVYQKMQGISANGTFSPMAANDFLGKEVLATGRFALMRGFKVTSNANALGRVGGVSDEALAKPIHYIWAFEGGKTFGYGMRRAYAETQTVPGSVVLKQHIEYKICGFTMLYSGSQKSFLIPVTVS